MAPWIQGFQTLGLHAFNALGLQGFRASLLQSALVCKGVGAYKLSMFGLATITCGSRRPQGWRGSGFDSPEV